MEENINLNLEEASVFAKKFLLGKSDLPVCDIEDIIQDSSLKAIKNIDRFSGKSSFNTWFLSICKNSLYDLLAKRRREQIVPLEDIGEESVAYEGSENNLLLIDSLGQLIESLTFNQRQIINLCLEQGLSTKQASLLLGIPVGSVRTRLFYARKTLRKLIYAHQSDI